MGLLRKNGIPLQGIYQCIVENETDLIESVYVGLYNSGGGIAFLYIL